MTDPCAASVVGTIPPGESKTFLHQGQEYKCECVQQSSSGGEKLACTICTVEQKCKLPDGRKVYVGESFDYVHEGRQHICMCEIVEEKYQLACQDPSGINPLFMLVLHN